MQSFLFTSVPVSGLTSPVRVSERVRQGERLECTVTGALCNHKYQSRRKEKLLEILIKVLHYMTPLPNLHCYYDELAVRPKDATFGILKR